MRKRLRNTSIRELKVDVKEKEVSLIFKYGGWFKIIAYVGGLVLTITSLLAAIFLVVGAIEGNTINQTTVALSALGFTVFSILTSMLTQMENNMRAIIKDNIEY